MLQRTQRLKEKVLRDINGRKLSKQQIFPKRKKSPPKLYQFEENPNTKNFFWFSKDLIREERWAQLSSSSKAVYPVIACHCDEKGEAFPGETRIGILSGRSERIVRKGTRGLEDLWPDYFTVNRGEKGKKIYTIKLPARNKEGGLSFLFYKFILESGVWRELKPSAQALYPVMRCYGWFDLENYNNLAGKFFEPHEYDEVYRTRHFDLLHYSRRTKKGLAEFAGIDPSSVKRALEDLERNRLIETLRGGWQVYLRTKDRFYYPREYLNEKIHKSYKHKVDL